MLLLDKLDESNLVLEEFHRTSEDTFAVTPGLDSGLMSDYPPFSYLQIHGATLWDLQHAFGPYTPPSSSEFSQDADECVDTPYHPLPSDSAVGECQVMPTIDLSDFIRPNNAESIASTSCKTTLLQPSLEPSSPSDDPSQYSDSLKGDSASPTAAAESSPTGDTKPVKCRKRRPTQTAKLDDTIICAHDSPAAQKKDRKAHVRGCHNQVEKNYRNRLNNDFQLLFNALSEYTDSRGLAYMGFTEGGVRNHSKGSILRLARRRLLALQTENAFIASQLKTIRRNWREGRMGQGVKPLGENGM
ncbi:Helix-loop-helix DNA-binding protein [Metarhizium guizhouense ARSEF 977]|uniref:Helix-loop-helix DNA-binding protein n=1 Tax=Metarhizium guizhouense (strain ARSEF 977) TaxID=1276136 RepID=A0A0B4HXS0_METGA|nr:Helix-loop-helix DNA-binding protein [Metarhizium guizhouense ARSEF 977]